MLSEKEKIDLITQISLEINEVKDLDILLERILTHVRRFFNADAGSIYLKQGDGLKFSYEYEPNQYQLGSSTWSSGGCRTKRIITNDYSYAFSGDHDYTKKDTSLFVYGADGSGIGSVTSMPSTYLRGEAIREVVFGPTPPEQPIPRDVLYFGTDWPAPSCCTTF